MFVTERLSRVEERREGKGERGREKCEVGLGGMGARSLQEKEGQRRYGEKVGSGEVTDRRIKRIIRSIIMHRSNYTISRTEQRTAIYHWISLISILEKKSIQIDIF